MNEYVSNLTAKLDGIDGFVLKEGSPSCSISRIRYYSGPEKGARIVTEGSGFLGEAVLEKFKGIPIESDGRLRNSRIRETYLTKIFLLSDLRRTMMSKRIYDLIQFHSRNKYLIMTFGQKYVKLMGRIVSNQEKKPIDEVLDDYWTMMGEVMQQTPRSTSIVNVMMHLFGYFSKDLSKKEKDTFLNKLESYRKRTASLTSLREMLKMWAIRFDESYVEEQTAFQPFPEELNSICDVVSYRREH